MRKSKKVRSVWKKYRVFEAVEFALDESVGVASERVSHDHQVAIDLIDLETIDARQLGAITRQLLIHKQLLELKDFKFN